MTDNVKKTIRFMREKFNEVEYFRKDSYRYEHSLRVGKIGEQIAIAENLDVEALTIGCLLHDIGYTICKTEEDFDNHGKLSADIARPFLESIGYSEELIESICYGIFIHTDNSTPEREPTPFELSIQTADNIDRFDTYRVFEGLRFNKVNEKKAVEIIDYGTKRIDTLINYMNFPCGTVTGTKMWKDVLSYQIEFHRKLVEQMKIVADMEEDFMLS